jgi:hypothetical protein
MVPTRWSLDLLQGPYERSGEDSERAGIQTPVVQPIACQ